MSDKDSIAEYLLMLEENPAIVDRGDKVCSVNYINELYQLVKRNLYFFACNQFGKTALFVAVQSHRIDHIAALLKHKANWSLDTLRMRAPIIEAADSGFNAAVVAFLNANNDIANRTRSHHKVRLGPGSPHVIHRIMFLYYIIRPASRHSFLHVRKAIIKL